MTEGYFSKRSRSAGEAEPAATGYASDGLLEAIVATSPDGLITIHQDGTIASFNPAAERMFGYRNDEIIGQNVSVLMPDPDRTRHDGYIHHYLTTGERRIIGIGREVEARHKDGRVFPVELAVGEVCAGSRRMFAGFVRDISARHAAEQRLQQLQNELLHVSRLTEMGEMASALAHELNQPLTAIINYLQASRRGLVAQLGESSKAVGLVQKAADQATRAGHIIQHLRRFIATGETERNFEAINRVVEEAAQLALVGIRQRAIAAHFELAPELPRVLIDKVQIQQVIINLVRNSIEALAPMPQRLLVLKTGRTADGAVQVDVIDSGPGLAPEVAARLFQPFVTTKPGGLGIGLSICRTIVDAHEGRLWATDNPGGGTIFHIALPVPAEREPEHG